MPQHDVATVETWPRFFDAYIANDGRDVEIVLREFDGSLSSITINIQQVAD